MTKPTLKELIDAAFAGKIIQFGFLNVTEPTWKDIPNTNHDEVVIGIVGFFDSYQYRIKPDKKVIQYRNFLTTDCSVGVWYSAQGTPQYAYENCGDFKCWINATQEYEIECD